MKASEIDMYKCELGKYCNWRMEEDYHIVWIEHIHYLKNTGCTKYDKLMIVKYRNRAYESL